MGTRHRSRYTEVEGIETTDIENFPYSALKVLGGIHVGLGVTCLVLGLIDLILYLFVDDTAVISQNVTLMTMTIAASPVWCGLWVGSQSDCRQSLARDMCHVVVNITILYLFVDDTAVISQNVTLMTMTIAASPVWCGLWVGSQSDCRTIFSAG